MKKWLKKFAIKILNIDWKDVNIPDDFKTIKVVNSYPNIAELQLQYQIETKILETKPKAIKKEIAYKLAHELGEKILKEKLVKIEESSSYVPSHYDYMPNTRFRVTLKVIKPEEK